MKQIQTKYEAPKVELIEMQTQGVLCASDPVVPEMQGTGFVLDWGNGAWVAG